MIDGGPAFPRPFSKDEHARFPDDAQEGMSLRDYFSAKFAAAWIIALSARKNESGYTEGSAIIEANRLGMLQADAMLKAREI